MAQGLTSHDPAIAKQGKPMVTSGCGPENGKKVLTDAENMPQVREDSRVQLMVQGVLLSELWRTV